MGQCRGVTVHPAPRRLQGLRGKGRAGALGAGQTDRGVHAVSGTLGMEALYYGLAGNFSALCKVYRAAERYWYKMLIVSSRSRKGVLRWPVFHWLKQRYLLQRPKLVPPYRAFQQCAVL